MLPLVHVEHALTGEALCDVIVGPEDSVRCVASKVAKLSDLAWRPQLLLGDVLLQEDDMAIASGLASDVVVFAIFCMPPQVLASGSRDHSVKVWNFDSKHCDTTLLGHTGPVWSVALGCGRAVLASCSADHTLRAWNVQTGDCSVLCDTSSGENSLDSGGHTADVWSVEFSPDDLHILTSSWDATAKIWDVETGCVVRTFRGHSAPVRAASFASDGKSMLTCSNDGTARVWDTKSGLCVVNVPVRTPVGVASFSPDGRKIVTGSKDGSVKLWDVAADTSGAAGLCMSVQAHSGRVVAASFAPDGRHILTATGNILEKRAHVWNVETGRKERTIIGVQPPAIFSTDGVHILTGSAGNFVQSWSVETGESCFRLDGHTGQVSSLSMS
eukprot:TRINITY_DN39630_c0_g1_i1.p1 TRINITY_DN39630_c0_g1~~TRINITY_DN39630_c0_g1_i1.p1  ORF type:complete len:385 (+),score=36.83 TRINITY_DN39630_c0_g1_i1:42-1196(+)